MTAGGDPGRGAQVAAHQHYSMLGAGHTDSVPSGTLVLTLAGFKSLVRDSELANAKSMYTTPEQVLVMFKSTGCVARASAAFTAPAPAFVASSPQPCALVMGDASAPTSRRQPRGAR